MVNSKEYPKGTRTTTLWCVYDHPLDYPNNFVARAFVDEKPTGRVIITDSLQTIRLAMERWHLMQIARNPLDEPQIVEVWI